MRYRNHFHSQGDAASTGVECGNRSAARRTRYVVPGSWKELLSWIQW